MINSRKEKEFVNKQVERLENALDDLRTKLLPNNPELFKIMGSNYFEKIKELRREIDLYLGLVDQSAEESSDFIIRLQGPKIGFGNAPISVVSRVLEDFRKSFQDIFSHLSGYKKSRKLPKYILEACDMSITGVFEGSLQVALKRPVEQLNLFESSCFEKSANVFFFVADWASKELPEEALIQEVPDNELRDLAIKSVLRITPKSNKTVNRISLYGNLVRQNITLTKQSRDFMLDNISKVDDKEVIHTYKGKIREVDLDRNSFKLREIDGSPGISEVIGHIDEKLFDDLRESLDSLAIIKGVQRSETNLTKTLDVRYIEKVESD